MQVIFLCSVGSKGRWRFSFYFSLASPVLQSFFFCRSRAVAGVEPALCWMTGSRSECQRSRGSFFFLVLFFNPMTSPTAVPNQPAPSKPRVGGVRKKNKKKQKKTRTADVFAFPRTVSCRRRLARTSPRWKRQVRHPSVGIQVCFVCFVLFFFIGGVESSLAAKFINELSDQFG